MESATTILTNNTTYSNYIRVYFYKDQEQSYNMVIVSYDNNRVNVTERKSFQVLINFVPEDFVEYEFDVVEATSSYLRLTHFSNEYVINFMKESTERNYGENVLEYEPEYKNNETQYQESNIIWEQCPTNESENEMYEYPDDYDSEDGYDSEGYYFRVR